MHHTQKGLLGTSAHSVPHTVPLSTGKLGDLCNPPPTPVALSHSRDGQDHTLLPSREYMLEVPVRPDCSEGVLGEIFGDLGDPVDSYRSYRW